LSMQAARRTSRRCGKRRIPMEYQVPADTGRGRQCLWAQVTLATIMDSVKIFGSLLGGGSLSLWLHLALIGVATGRIALDDPGYTGAGWGQLRIVLMTIFWVGLAYDVGTVIAWVSAVLSRPNTRLV
jgi:hypothetical protein